MSVYTTRVPRCLVRYWATSSEELTLDDERDATEQRV